MAEPSQKSEFVEIVTTARSGSGDRIASMLIPKIVGAVREYGGVGSLVVTLKISLMEDGDGEINIDIGVKPNFPQIKIPRAIMYADDKNKLTRADPRQMSMIPDHTEPRQREEGDINQLGRGKVLDLQANR